eukprot:maker-scaffold_1-snap-gene-25.13-mRNA-1 protein AED:0.08 eAED:0.19 QI:0/0.5/0.66/1/0.5/0.33/3/728/254
MFASLQQRWLEAIKKDNSFDEFRKICSELYVENIVNVVEIYLEENRRSFSKRRKKEFTKKFFSEQISSDLVMNYFFIYLSVFLVDCYSGEKPLEIFVGSRVSKAFELFEEKIPKENNKVYHEWRKYLVVNISFLESNTEDFASYDFVVSTLAKEDTTSTVASPEPKKPEVGIPQRQVQLCLTTRYSHIVRFTDNSFDDILKICPINKSVRRKKPEPPLEPVDKGSKKQRIARFRMKMEHLKKKTDALKELIKTN